MEPRGHTQLCMCAVSACATARVCACRQELSAKLVVRNLTDLYMQKTEHPQIGCNGKCDSPCLGRLLSISYEETDYFTIKLSGNMLELVLI